MGRRRIWWLYDTTGYQDRILVEYRELCQGGDRKKELKFILKKTEKFKKNSRKISEIEENSEKITKKFSTSIVTSQKSKKQGGLTF